MYVYVTVSTPLIWKKSMLHLTANVFIYWWVSFHSFKYVCMFVIKLKSYWGNLTKIYKQCTCTRNYAEFRPECDFESGNRMKNTFCKSKKMSFKHTKGNTFVSYVYYRGQQLAQQMEQTNPELVAQLRTQFGRGPPTSDGGDPSQQSKMWSMYGLLYWVLKQ